MGARRWQWIVALCLFSSVPLWAYLTFPWPLEQLAQAPVLATCTVEETRLDPAASTAQRIVMAHAAVRVLRSYPPSALITGDRLRLDYEALPAGASPMNGPDVAQIQPGDTLALALKSNPQPASAPWRLIGDEGALLVIPAIASTPRFDGSPRDGRDFLLREIASVLLDGARPEVLAAASYASWQKGIGPGLVTVLESRLSVGDDRWSLIAALSVACLGVPRPGVAGLRAGKDSSGGDHFSGSLVTAVLQKLGPSEPARQSLIHQLLVNSDIASWGVGMTVPEFAQDPSLVQELRRMLRARNPGALSVARSILIAGQNQILPDATALSLDYLATPPADPSELQAACWVIRDFGTDQQFNRLVADIRDAQYRARARYDALWRNILWSDNPRERAVLAILLKDDRFYQGEMRYSEVARGELSRLAKQATAAR